MNQFAIYLIIFSSMVINFALLQIARSIIRKAVFSNCVLRFYVSVLVHVIENVQFIFKSVRR